MFMALAMPILLGLGGLGIDLGYMSPAKSN
jgi:Flp pilus assembly protein TadG